MSDYGDATLRLIEAVFDEGATHAAVLMRHSAREFEAGRHDLENPLTDEGRELASRLGAGLPKDVLVRGYASPAERCLETAELMLAGHQQGGGRSTRHRPIEALGVFYVLDQMKMFKAMTAAGGQLPFLGEWFDERVPTDVMMPAELAARLVAGVVTHKLDQVVERPQLDVCVSHDMTVYTVRRILLGVEAAAETEVRFLDGVIFYETDGEVRVRSMDGASAAFPKPGKIR
jgi:broad specificity phosphatase PhoE